MPVKNACRPLAWFLCVICCAISSARAEELHQEIPSTFPSWDDASLIQINNRPVHIVPRIQSRLKRFLHYRRDPVAAVMVVEVSTGNVLAMVQGAAPHDWGSETNTNLHTGFPAASLFKTVVAAAALENMPLDPRKKFILDGGCAAVSPKGYWMRNDLKGRRFKLDLRRAYGSSCNGFFAKIAVNEIGFGPILDMAQRFGWNQKAIPADFHIPISRIKPPDPSTSSAHMVGRFAAGFGYVGLSVAHAAWQMLAIANYGYAMPLSLFSDDDENTLGPTPYKQVIQSTTAEKLRSLMDATVLGGTATSSFNHGKYRKIRRHVGGKTGTLTGSFPRGVTTWFAGMYPLDKPEVVIASVVVLKDLWHVKAPDLAAEAVISYLAFKKSSKIAKLKMSQGHKN